jgi:RNA polymerase sigma-70 factor, ECF subfamily
MDKSNRCLEKSDEELVKQSLTDNNYFSYLVERYEKRLLFYIRRISGLNLEDAEDILQEIFIKVFYNLNDFDSALKFSSWIYRIAHNETITELRKRKVRPQVLLVDEEWQKIASSENLLEAIHNQHLSENITLAIGKLDEKYQEVLVLRFLEGKDYAEISDILKRPVSTIGTLVRRARQKFKEEFSKINL